MNGEPLPPVHGSPLRVVVPGYISARSVKWLERIEVRSTPWSGHFQHVATPAQLGGERDRVVCPRPLQPKQLDSERFLC